MTAVLQRQADLSTCPESCNSVWGTLLCPQLHRVPSSTHRKGWPAQEANAFDLDASKAYRSLAMASEKNTSSSSRLVSSGSTFSSFVMVIVLNQKKVSMHKPVVTVVCVLPLGLVFGSPPCAISIICRRPASRQNSVHVPLLVTHRQYSLLPQPACSALLRKPKSHVGCCLTRV